MATRPEGMPWLTPLLTVRDAARALDFYEAAFGFTRRDVMTDSVGTVTHADMTYRDAVVMVAPEDDASPTGARPPSVMGMVSPVILYLYCDDVDAQFARATACGANVVSPPADMPWFDRMCSLTDPDGYVWNFATHLGYPPAEGP